MVKSDNDCPRLAWQQQLIEAIEDPLELFRLLELDPQLIQAEQLSIRRFPLRVPRAFLSRMEKGNINDPLLRQVLPDVLEEAIVPGFSVDPLNEISASPVPGILHKYHGRALMMLTGACAINCRYCFRQHYPYAEQLPGLSQWQPALAYLAAQPSIQEVILSGGDPLLVKDNNLLSLIQQLETIPQLSRLRIHTRLPIVIPDRMTDTLVKLLDETRFKVVMVLHSNHAQELDDSVRQAIQPLRHVTLLNQAVLLKGVNDSTEALVNLSQRLFELNILPYYLHQLDLVAGAAHFQIPLDQAQQLMKQIAAQLPGYLVPKLAQEIPSEPSKRF